MIFTLCSNFLSFSNNVNKHSLFFGIYGFKIKLNKITLKKAAMLDLTFVLKLNT